ncbi:hypothetical protein DPMN_102232 [Dreissena polymorpha]|uniref:Uncharacterized protein n=1 Tax=Dreissena polymorpha TaxID=45954 RepID=A0A9D4LIX9_DREPO|nr:hypothetical protein DPMN_102232 [Dreissena polymorpha]
MLYVRAERGGDCPLHWASVKLIISYFFAAAHQKLREIRPLLSKANGEMPESEQDKFLNSEHLIRHVPVVGNAIRSDMFIETTCRRYGHCKTGITDSTLKPEILKYLSLSLHICSRIDEDMRAISSAN